jgi:tetratricopeptide (TPR) repeat protein
MGFAEKTPENPLLGVQLRASVGPPGRLHVVGLAGLRGAFQACKHALHWIQSGCPDQFPDVRQSGNRRPTTPLRVLSRMNFLLYPVLTQLWLVLPLVSAAMPQGQLSARDYIRQAERFMADNNYQQARVSAGKAVELDPHSGEAAALVGAAEFGLGDLEAAQKSLQAALDLEPGLLLARRTLGGVYLKERRTKEARREFELALNSHPQDFVSLYSLGLTFLVDKEPAEARLQFEKASAQNPRDPRALLGMLQADISLNQPSQAANDLAKLDAELGARDALRYEIAALLVNAGAYELAIQEFERLRQVDPGSDDLNYNLALAYHRVGKEGQASELLQHLLAREEKAELENLLGEVELTRNNFPRALAAFRRAAELEPGSEDYRYDYAQSLVSQRSFDQALDVFARAAADFPNSPRIWLGWGGTYYLVGKYKEAARTLLHAAEIGPRWPPVYYLLGRAYDASGPLQDTITKQFAAYLRTDPRDAWAQYFYGRILAESSQPASSERLSEAREYLERAIALDHNLAEAHAELGKLLDQRGQVQAARKELEIAEQLDPQSSATCYWLVQVYRKLGESALALRAMARFEQLKTKERKNVDREQIQGFLARAKEGKGKQ